MEFGRFRVLARRSRLDAAGEASLPASPRVDAKEEVVRTKTLTSLGSRSSDDST
jgi:hypothetical protein